MKKKTIRTHGQRISGLPFQGEMMVCQGCGKQKRSNPTRESGWTMLEVDGQKYYYCIKCFKQLLRTH